MNALMNWDTNILTPHVNQEIDIGNLIDQTLKLNE